MYGFCIFCNKNIDLKKKRRGKKPLFCCIDHRYRYRKYNLLRAQKIPMRWRDDSEKHTFYAAQRRRAVANDPLGWSQNMLKTMDGEIKPEPEEITQPQPEPELKKSETGEYLIKDIHYVKADGELKLRIVIPAKDIAIGDILAIGVRKVGKL